MRRVELIGPPGVGKTTLLKLLLRELQQRGMQAASPRWLPLWAYHERHRTAGVRRRCESVLYRLKGAHRWMRPKLEKEMIRHEFRGLRDAVSPWPEFLRLGLQQGVNAAPNPALALERMQSFIGGAAHARAADRLPGELIVPFDEGLAQRGISLGQDASAEEVTKYFRLMPAPAALVVVFAPAELIQDRLRQRNPNVIRFHAMVDQALRICNLARVIGAEREIPVVAADAAAAPAETARVLAAELFDLLSVASLPAQESDASGSRE